MNRDNRRVGLLRRLGAMLYDSLAAFSVLFIADALVVIPLQALWGIESIGKHPLFQLYQFVVIYVFFAWFWVHGGQTLGLRAWRIRVVREDGAPLQWSDAAKRFAAAILSWLPLGAGFLWAAFDRQGLAWHDRMSRTRLEHAA
jgi:uncharacterized RDD family membrane protein YckC